MVGDEDPDPAGAQVGHQVADVGHRDRIDARKGFVEQDVARVGGQAARDFRPPPFAPRQRQRRRAAQVVDGEVGQKFLEPLAAHGAVGLGDFEDRQDVVLDRQAAEDRRFLRQVADPQPRAAVHRHQGDVAPVDQDLTALGHHQPRDGVEAGGLARSVGTKQRHDLAPVQVQRHVADHRAAAVGLAQPAHDQAAGAFGHGQGGACGGQFPPSWPVLWPEPWPVSITVRTRPSSVPVPSRRFTTIRSEASVFGPWVRSTLPSITRRASSSV